MNIKQLNKSKLPIVRIDKTLEEYKDKVLFPEKVENANQVLKTVGMPKRKLRAKTWTARDERQLNVLAQQHTPTRVIGLKLGRTPRAVRTKASEVGVSLKPTNQSPYNRSK